MKNEPACGGLALFAKFAAIQGFFNSPNIPLFPSNTPTENA